MTFPSTDTAYEKLRLIRGKKNLPEPMDIWHAKVKDQEVILKIFDLDHRNSDFLEQVQVILDRKQKFRIQDQTDLFGLFFGVDT